MFWLATTLKLVAEVALLAWVGRWLLGALLGLGGAPREANFAWRVLDAAARPALRLAQALLRRPGAAAEALAFAGLAALWLGATAWKVQLVRACLAALAAGDAGAAACR